MKKMIAVSTALCIALCMTSVGAYAKQSDTAHKHTSHATKSSHANHAKHVKHAKSGGSHKKSHHKKSSKTHHQA
ncbi:hypothetical protein AAKU67_003502 [Oxalobacteraceae bacterium GrIS 2.11]